jgi:hypothetical protein
VPEHRRLWREHRLEPETRIVCIGAPQGAAQPYGEWIDEAEPVGY